MPREILLALTVSTLLGKHQGTFGPLSVLLTSTVSGLLGGVEVYFLADRYFSFLTCLYHSVDAGVNYLLRLVLLAATVPGGT